MSRTLTLSDVELEEITGGLTLEQARALPIGGPGYWLSEEEIVRVTGKRQPVHQLVELARLGFARAWRARRNSGRVRVPRLHVVAELDERRRAAEPVAMVDPEEEPKPRAPWSETALGKWQAEQREIAREREAANAQHEKEDAAWLKANAKLIEQRRREQRAALVRHHAGKRRAARLRRTPAWADLAAILAVYREARRLTAETGIPHHVDHELPLQGRLVSGLHVHNNLQILTGSENSRKRNRFDVG